MEFWFASPGDQKAIKELLGECGLPYEDMVPSRVEHFIVAREDDLLCGVVGVEIMGKFSLLRSLTVRSNHRNQGVASQLTCRAEAHARSQGVEAVYLLTTTADGFFSKRGYERIDRSAAPAVVQQTTEFCSLCPSAAICMVRHW